MPNNHNEAPPAEVPIKDEFGAAKLPLVERVSTIPCLCPQCGGNDSAGDDTAVLMLADRGKDSLEAEQLERKKKLKHVRKTRKPAWTAEELASIEDRDDRAQIAATGDIDINCGHTRFVINDLAEEGFWGHVALDRLTPAPVPEKARKPRLRRKQTKPVALFDLFGDFGVIVPINDQAHSSKIMNGASASEGDK